MTSNKALSQQTVFYPKNDSTLEDAHPPPSDKQPETNPPPPPDGGLTAWLQVLVNFLTTFCAWGFSISYGVFVPYYETLFGLDPSSVAWIGSVQASLVFIVGLVTGRLFDAGYLRALLLVGFGLQVVGMVLTSVSVRYWQFFLAQGLVQGVGGGLVFTSGVANVSTWFRKKRTMVVALAASGSAVGGVVFPLIAQQLLPKIGFGWTLRTMALLVFICGSVASAVARTRLPPKKSGPWMDWSGFKEAKFSLYLVSTFFFGLILQVAFYYARAYALDQLGASESTSFIFLLIISGVGLPGRLIAAWLASRYFGSIDVLLPTAIATGALMFAWAGVHSITGGYVWISIFGYFSAGVSVLSVAVVPALTKDLSLIGVRIGALSGVQGIAALMGPPLAGKLIDVAGGSYIGAQIWGGSCILVGAGFLFAARQLNRRDARREGQELDNADC